MNVLALTIFVGAVLVTMFVALWVFQALSNHSPSEREALLPLEEDLSTRPQISNSTRP